MFCIKCGKPNSDNNNFCISCGTKLFKPSVTSVSEESREEILENMAPIIQETNKVKIYRATGKTFENKDIDVILDGFSKGVLSTGSTINTNVNSKYHEIEFKLDYLNSKINFDTIENDDVKIVIWTEGNSKNDWLRVNINDYKGTIQNHSEQLVPSKPIEQNHSLQVKSEAEMINRIRFEMERRSLDIEKEQLRIQQQQYESMAKCPRCGSVTLVGNKKGFGIGKAVVGAAIAGPIGLVAGNIGSKKVIVTCLKCGKKYKA